VVSYFVLAFGFAWAAAATAGAVAERLGASGGGVVLPVFLGMTVGPTTASLLLTGYLDGRAGYRDLLSRLTRWRVGGRWYAALLINPLAIAVVLGVLTLTSSDFVPGVVADPGARLAMAVAGGLAAGLFEEIGWTGFATPRLLERRSAVSAGLVLGLLWSAWHIGPDVAGTATAAEWGPLWGWRVLLWMFAGMAPYRVLMTWVYRHTGSLLVGVLMHAVYTGGQILLEPAALSPTQQLLWWGLLDLVLLGVAGVVAAVDRRERRTMDPDRPTAPRSRLDWPNSIPPPSAR
jgi:membrane protease YdiL (CAAX protease family)